MSKKVQVTLTSNESKVLIAKAAAVHPALLECMKNGGRVLLAGGTTVSALSEELGFGALRISGRIAAGGTRTALEISDGTAHNLLIYRGKPENVDDSICRTAESMGAGDLIVAGANAIDPYGRAALAFAALGGGSRGYALHSAYMQGVPMLVLSGINKLIPDLAPALAQSSRTGVDTSMGCAIGLYNLFAPIITEVRAFELLFGIEAVVIAGSGIGDGDGSRTFVLNGEEEAVQKGWELVLSIKGADVSGSEHSLKICCGGCVHCARHLGCIYKAEAMA